MNRHRGFHLVHVIALGAGLLLSACADEAGPRFANDPMPTRAATESPAVASPAPLPTTPALATPVVATPASIADLLSVRGAPSRLFVLAGNAVWAISSDGEAARIFEAPADSQLVAIDQSPSAENVAVLLRAEQGASAQGRALILDAAGEVVASYEEPGAPAATPGAVALVADAIDWSPQGNRVLATFGGSDIVVFSPNGDTGASRMSLDSEVGDVIQPLWSPTGESIAFISEGDGGPRSLRTVAVDGGEITDVVTPLEGRQVSEFAWMPNGRSLLFTEGSAPGAPTTGTDLWWVDANGENRELVASAGTVAPVARVVKVKPSPDGRSVAYAVLVPGPGGAQVDSVWVRDLRSRLGFRVALPAVGAVENIWWTNQGVVILVRTEDAGPSRPATEALLRVNRDGGIGVLWAAPIARGTPVSVAPAATPETA